MIMLVITIVLSALGTALIFRDMARSRKFPALPTPDTLTHASPASISIIIPARNEAKNIRRSVEGALAQSPAVLREVIVVDDASTDETPQILADIERKHIDPSPALKIVQGRPLPEGWVGKCNACAHGAAHATGEWLLFLDADTAPGPHLARALMHHARDNRLDALSVITFQELGSLAEKLIIPAFMQLIMQVIPKPWVANPNSPPNRTLANGQCIFVSRAAYDQIDGHTSIKDSVLEDVQLARTLRSAGVRYAMADGSAHIRVRMYRNGREVMEGFTKNTHAGAMHNPLRTLVGGLECVMMTSLPPLAALGLLIASFIAKDAMISLATLAATIWWAISLLYWRAALQQLYGLSGHLAILMPLGLMGVQLIALRSIYLTRFGGGVRWKDRKIDRA